MPITEWNWKSRDGLKMYARRWTPESPSKAIFCLLHGHGEHINRYNHVGEAFTRAGYILQGYDLRGHGQSGGPRGHTPSYDHLLNDIDDFLAEVRKQNPGLPVFLYGHSMGGNQVANYTLRFPEELSGVILSSPWLRLAFASTALRLALAKLMNVLIPSYFQHSGLDAATISRDPAVMNAYITDPLVHDHITARLFSVIHANGLAAIELADTLKIPVLLMHGSADRLTSMQASQEFAAKAGSLVTLRIWDGFYHELHNEPEKADVLRVMIDWADKQLGSQPYK